MSPTESSQGRVLEAALELFVQQGYHGTSMRQIAERAGLAPGSVYNHFNGKEDIFYHVIFSNHPFHKILPILDSAEGEDAEALISNVAHRIYAVMQSRQDLLHLLFIEIVEFDGKHFSQIFDLASPNIFAFIQKLQKEKGQLRPIPDANILLAIMGLVMSHWILETVFLRNINLPMTQDHFEAALDIYLHGILADKGTP